MQRKLSTSMIINEDGTYLENYLSTIGELPNDVKRSLAVIKEIDLFTSYKLSKVVTLTQEAISAPPLSKARNEIIKAIQNELAETEALAEEKKSLTTQAIDLVDGHKKTLELVLEKFSKELFGETSKDVFSIFKTNSKKRKSTSIEHLPKKKIPETNENIIVESSREERDNKRKSGTKKKEDEKEEKVSEIKKEIKEEKDVIVDKPIDASTQVASVNVPEVVGEVDTNLYCFCQRMSFGEMVGCDNPKCKYQWFHFECLGITSAPKGKWYCPECRKLKRKRH